MCIRDRSLVDNSHERLDCIMIPKVGNSSDIYAVDALVTALEKKNKRKKNLDFEIIIETAAGLENINEIVTLSRENGYTFFDKERQEQHRTRVLPTLYGGKYFITESIHEGMTLFSVFKALKDGACDIVRGEVFLSERSAQRYLKIAILSNEQDNDIEEVSYELC